MHEFFEPAENLTITGTDAELTLDDGNGDLVRLEVDGKSHTHEGGVSETTARWKGAALEVESKTDRGSSLTTTYAVDPTTHKLEVTTRLSGHGDPVSVRRVYDTAAAPTGS